MIAANESDHERFEELGALAALGQISERELIDLETHLAVCAACRAEYADFVNLVHHKLPLVIDPQRKTSGKRVGLFFQSRKYKKEFLARAQQNGFHFSEEVRLAPSLRDRLVNLFPFSLSYQQALALMLILSLALIGVQVHKLRESTSHNKALLAEVARLDAQTAAQRQELLETSRARNSKGTGPDRPLPLTTKSTGQKDLEAADFLAVELSKSRNEYATALARVQEMEGQLQAASSAAQALRSEVETGKTAGSRFESKLREAEVSISQMNEEIQKLRNTRLTDTDQIAAQEAHVKELSEKLKVQTEMLERERSLLAAGRDVRDLMGARNLHIIDVFDVDGSGRSNRTFGRVFYTEGRSLIFYAYDLGGKKGSLAKASFQAWGYRSADERALQSLGIFYVDDKNQNRWVLKFDDPEVLAHVDSVFVTIEPQGGSGKPTGQKLLYAYLNNRPNHP